MLPSSVHIGALVVVASLAMGGVASAQRPSQEPFVPAPSPTASEVGVTERLGERVPLDVGFRDHTGRAVTLGDLVRGDLPVILTFNYSACPQLCNMQLTSLMAALPGSPLRLGRHFRLVTITLEPGETPQSAAATRERYLERLSGETRAAAEAGWTVLVAPTAGDDKSVRTLAAAVGVRYRYLEDKAEWAHPAALIMLTPSGVIARYVGDVHYESQVLTDSVKAAAMSRPQESYGFILACMTHSGGGVSSIGATVMRWGGAAFVLLFAAGLGGWLVGHRRKLPAGAVPT